MANNQTQLPTQIPSLSQEQWTQALLAGFPATWSSREARKPGGGIYGMFNGIGANLSVINQFLIYGFNSTRIETATDTALDLAADDFYGIGGLPRKAGESDDSYRQRILAGLFIPYTTKEAFIQAITALTGNPPVLIEPWKAAETSAYDWSYYDVNIPARPGVYGDPSLAYQVFIIVNLPPPTGSEQATAIWGYDAGAAYDIYTGTYWNLKAADFITQAELDALINRIKAFGITVWRKYQNAQSLPFPIPNSFNVVPGQFIFNPAIQPFLSPYIVLASGNWNAQYAVSDINTSGFTIETSAPSVTGSRLNYVIIPIAQPEIVQGAGFLGINPGATTANIPVPQAPATPGNRVAITPNWNTNFWITNIGSSNISIEFSGEAPPGAALNYFFSPPSRSAFYSLTSADQANLAVNIPIANLPPCCPFVTPSWNTGVGVSATSGGIQAKFDSPPPNGAFVQYSWFPLAG